MTLPSYDGMMYGEEYLIFVDVVFFCCVCIKGNPFLNKGSIDIEYIKVRTRMDKYQFGSIKTHSSRFKENGSKLTIL
jgi:hypothetical protein